MDYLVEEKSRLATDGMASCCRRSSIRRSVSPTQQWSSQPHSSPASTQRRTDRGELAQTTVCGWPGSRIQGNMAQRSETTTRCSCPGQTPARGARRTISIVVAFILVLASLSESATPLATDDDIPAIILCRATNLYVVLKCPHEAASLGQAGAWKRTDSDRTESFGSGGDTYTESGMLIIVKAQMNVSGEYEAWTNAANGQSSRRVCRVYLVVADRGNCEPHVKLAVSGKREISTVAGSKACMDFKVMINNAVVVRGMLTGASFSFEKFNKATRSTVALPPANSTRYDVERGSRLCVTHATVDDSAHYTIKAYLGDEFGFLEKYTARMKVRMPAALLRQYLVVETTVQVMQLTCTAQGNPLPVISWYRDDILLSRHTRIGSTRRVVTRHSNGTEVLTLTDRPSYTVTSTLILPVSSAVGIYTCDVWNKGKYGRRQVSRPTVIDKDGMVTSQ